MELNKGVYKMKKFFSLFILILLVLSQVYLFSFDGFQDKDKKKYKKFPDYKYFYPIHKYYVDSTQYEFEILIETSREDAIVVPIEPYPEEDTIWILLLSKTKKNK